MITVVAASDYSSAKALLQVVVKLSYYHLYRYSNAKMYPGFYNNTKEECTSYRECLLHRWLVVFRHLRAHELLSVVRTYITV